MRLDKVRTVEMKWRSDELRNMIGRRLAAFSDGRVKSLTAIVEGNVGDGIYDTVIRHAVRSPREIVQVLDSIFREHARHSSQNTGAMITTDSVDRGLDEYCLRRANDLFPGDVVRQISALPGAVFTNSDVQNVFRIAQPTASQRIGRWTDNGYVKRVDGTRSQKDPSKTVHQYEVSDPRLRRILERHLTDETTVA